MKWQILWIVLAAFCIANGFLMLNAASGTGFFAVWFGLGGIFILFFALARIHIWQKLPGPVHFVCLVFLAAAVFAFVFVEVKISTGFGQRGELDLKYIVVLGAQVHEDGPSVVLKYRLDKAREYLEDNPETICIVTGGQGPNEPFTEAQGMADYLEKKGIAPERILKEDASLNTVQNMRNSCALIDPEEDSVGIVTNNFHMYRALSLAKKAGMKHACGISADTTPLYLPNNLLREFFGVLKDTAAGNM